MFNCHANQIAVLVEFNVDVLADLPSPFDQSIGEFDQCRICVAEVFNSQGSQGVKLRSKTRSFPRPLILPLPIQK